MSIDRAALKAMLSSLVFGWEHGYNSYYGHNVVLREYAGLKLPFCVPGEIQHGWHRGSGIFHDLSSHGEAEKAFRHYVWNRRNMELCLEYGYRNCVAIGAPFLYLPQNNPSDAVQMGDRSLLLFPLHSIPAEPFVDPLRTHRRYLEEIEELRSSFDPITVCLYWFDYQNMELINLFKDRGITVTSLGHMSNPKFLTNFQGLSTRHAYVSSSRYDTALFYALYMRKKAFVFGESLPSGIQLIPLPANPQYPEMTTVYPELLWRNFDDRSHYWIGEEELGIEFKQSPSELRSLFGWTPADIARQAPHRLVARPCVVTKAAVGRIKRNISERLPAGK